MNFKKVNNGFSLLELILVITLLLLVFGIVGSIFVNNIKAVKELQTDIQIETRNLSFINQLSKQLFAKYEKKPENIIIQRDRVSFYTYYPVFFEGAVRAEYIFEKTDNQKIKVIYEEFPYVDNNLGLEGIKKQYIGTFNKVYIEILQRDTWLENYRGKRFPRIIKLTLDDSIFYIAIRRR